MPEKIVVRQRLTSGDIYDPEQREIRFRHQKRLSDGMWVISVAFAAGIAAVFVAIVIALLR